MNRLLLAGLTVPFAAGKPQDTVGGQAIIEGVMMRGKNTVSWAVKPADGETVLESFPFVSRSKRSRFWKLPVARGAINLYESLEIGFKALNRSAEIAESAVKPSDTKPRWTDRMMSAGVMGLALLISFTVFMYLPLKVLSFFVPRDSAFLYNLLAGAVRICFFVLYLLGINLIKDIRRLFEYHGAEHKAIFTYENGMELTPESTRAFSTFHPRCGTSFLLLVAIICILLFGLIDGAIIHFFGPYPSVLARTLTHLALIPIVSGVSYEALKLSDRYYGNPVVAALVAPGLWLQRITTRPPTDAQIAVALTALRAVL